MNHNKVYSHDSTIQLNLENIGHPPTWSHIFLPIPTPGGNHSPEVFYSFLFFFIILPHTVNSQTICLFFIFYFLKSSVKCIQLQLFFSFYGFNYIDSSRCSLFIFTFFFLKEFFFLINLFLAALVLPCCARRAGATLCHGAQASHCGGFSCCGARALGAQASVVAAPGLSSGGTRA